MNARQVHISKLLSLILRHKPEEFGLALDANGWVGIAELLEACRQRGETFSREELDAVVAQNDKRRFALSPDGQRIRASQGHSVEVDLQLQPVEPPELLYHGTVAKALDSIRRDGLLPGNRQQVHLSADVDTAAKVGQRRGRPVILKVEASRMGRDGLKFYRSENGVWLADRVPTEYIRFPEGGGAT